MKKNLFSDYQNFKNKLKTYRAVAREKFEKNGMKFVDVRNHFRGFNLYFFW